MLNHDNKSSDCKTFAQIYEEMATMPSPLTEFMRRINKATHCHDSTIRCWAKGKQVPRLLVQETISRELGIPVEELFPPELDPKKKQPKKNHKP